MHRNTWRVQGWLAALLLLVAGIGAGPRVALARKARRDPQKPASKAPPPNASPTPSPPEPAPPVPHIQRLVFTPYDYAYQADARRRIPVLGVRNPDGSSALTHHPWDGAGPWLSYDRTQWHKNQLSLMRSSGVDVVLPVFRGDTAARTSYAIKGLDCMAQALKELRQEREQPFARGKDFPLVGMYFDTEAMRAQFGEAPDMQTDAARRTFYGMIREFFLHVPPEFRATVPLPPERARAQHPIPGSQLAPGTAYVIFLSSPAPLLHLDAATLTYCSERLAKEFGAPVLWIGGPEFHGKADGLDGVLGPDGSSGGWIDVRPLSPGRDPSAAASAGSSVVRLSATAAPADSLAVPDPENLNTRTPEHLTIESRRQGRTYMEAWIVRLRDHPDWIFLDSWNDQRDGTEIASTHEFGSQYLDLTRVATNQFRVGGEYAVHILRATVPPVVQPRTVYQVQVMVQNTSQKGWTGGLGTGLSYRWFKDGQPVGDPAPVASTAYVGPNELRSFTVGLIGPMNGVKPLPDGDYELRLDMLKAPGVWFEAPGDLPYVVPVRVEGGDVAATPAAASTGAAGSPDHPYWITSGMPSLAKVGETYTVPIRVRNDSSVMWRKADGVAVGYRWLQVASDLHGITEEKVQRLEASGKLDLPADVPAGGVIVLQVPVRLADDSGKPLPVWSPKSLWCYQIEWDLFDGKRWASEAGAPTRREAVAALADDLGPSFIGTGLATNQPSGNNTTTKVGIRNSGPETWSANTDRLVYHWYFFDGSEARWAGLETPLPNDVKPGETVVVPDVRIQVPDFTGPMYLTLDLKRGQNYASTGSNSRGNDIYVLPVNVIGGAMLPVNLGSLFDTDGISSDTNRADGDLDGQGHTFPSELLPPYQWQPPTGMARLDSPIYPCGLWTRPVSEGDRVPFWYPVKGDGIKNLITCAGQRLEFPPGARAAVHLMGTATAPGAQGDMTLIYQDGTTSVVPLEMSSWTEGPQHGEHVAFTCLHRHAAAADEPGVRCSLYHYTLRPQRGKELAAIELPRVAAMKIMAITLETDTRTDLPGLHLPGVLAPK